MKRNENIEQKLMEDILSMKYSPTEAVKYLFPWGVKNTPLERFEGPRAWQMDDFKRIEDHLALDAEKQRIGLPPSPLYMSRSSGRGIGKSAWLNMLNMWVASCWIGSTTIVTANTETQLRSRTMAELGKWHMMAINRHWFDKAAMVMRPAKWFATMVEEQLQIDTQYYYVEGQAWSKENPDAFAGAHSQIGMMVQFDEASGIPDPIWDVTEGFFTDASDLRLWLAISNPRRNTGKFFDCFHKDRSYWDTKYIDSRTVEGLDRSVYDRIASKYGEDHDVTRIEVKGQFPRIGSNQFIGRGEVEDAQVRELTPDPGAPLILGVDVARYGSDETVLRYRRGRDARTIPPVRYKQLSVMDTASMVAGSIEKHKPDAVMVDGGGVGGGVVDRLHDMGYRVIEVQSGAKAQEPERYLNVRAEMTGRLKEWLATGCIDDDEQLAQDLTGPEFKVHLKGQIGIESKDDMKKRGLPSTNESDALGLTFAEKVAYDEVSARRGQGRGIWRQQAITDYDEFG